MPEHAENENVPEREKPHSIFQKVLSTVFAPYVIDLLVQD
jgi:hypothetical protein